MENKRRSTRFGTYGVGGWHVGTLARWDVGTLARWHVGTLERWNVGTLECISGRAF